jgi:hypothetical protein
MDARLQRLRKQLERLMERLTEWSWASKRISDLY